VFSTPRKKKKKERRLIKENIFYTFVNRNESPTQRLPLDLKEFRPISKRRTETLPYLRQEKCNFPSSKKRAKP
jgi:hypothetical protein